MHPGSLPVLALRPEATWKHGGLGAGALDELPCMTSWKLGRCAKAEVSTAKFKSRPLQNFGNHSTGLSTILLSQASTKCCAIPPGLEAAHNIPSQSVSVRPRRPRSPSQPRPPTTRQLVPSLVQHLRLPLLTWGSPRSSFLATPTSTSTSPAHHPIAGPRSHPKSFSLQIRRNGNPRR